MGRRLIILTDDQPRAKALLDTVVQTFDAAFAISDMRLARRMIVGLRPTAILSDATVEGKCAVALLEEGEHPADCRWIMRTDGSDADAMERAMHAGALAVLDDTAPRELLLHLLTGRAGAVN